MRPSIVVAISLSVVLACAHARTADPYGRVLERGGELADVKLEEKTVTVRDGAVTAWGVIEVPDGSRMSATYAGADAIARAELLKLVRVRVADVMVSIDSTDPARRAAYEQTVEVVGGFLRHAGAPRHAWERVQRDGEVILRVWSCVRVPTAQLDSALHDASQAAALPLPPNMLRALEVAESEP